MRSLMILIFLGSVFLTSGKFVNTENAVKFYFTVIALFIGLLILLIRNRNFKLDVQKITSGSVLKGFYVVGVFQSIYGILQFIGIYSSNHSSFAVTGSFDNPAGFIAVLSLLFSIGVVWCINSKGFEQRLVFFSLGVILFSIILSGSRTGLLAVLLSTISIITIEYRLFSKIRGMKYFKQLGFITIILLVFGLYELYKWKPDSANGRVLVWKSTTEMIKDRPVFGYGYDGFRANYMDYQAQYFKQNPQSSFKQLADNVTHPFNEFIKITVNYGITGLFISLFLLIIVVRKIFKKTHPFNKIFFGGFVSFVILSFFSYPLQYAPVWLFLFYSVLTLFSDRLSGNKFSGLIRIPLILGCFLGIIFFTSKMNHELEWKKIAAKSLQGNTEQMLPKYKKLYPKLNKNSLFLYNYAAELNVAHRYEESIIILHECLHHFNDYDLQMILADNYLKMGNTNSAEEVLKRASNMIPCRFLPLYKLFKLYEQQGNNKQAGVYAKEIIAKKVKIPSSIVSSIRMEADTYLADLNKQDYKN